MVGLLWGVDSGDVVWTVEMWCGQWRCGVDSGDVRWSGCCVVWTVEMWCGQWRC